MQRRKETVKRAGFQVCVITYSYVVCKMLSFLEFALIAMRI